MKNIFILLILIFISLNSKALEFRGVILQTRPGTIAKFYTKLNNKDYCTTIAYTGHVSKNKKLKRVFKITENKNNKDLKTYTVSLDNKDTLIINDTKFKFLIFRNQYIFLKIEEKEKYAKLL